MLAQYHRDARHPARRRAARRPAVGRGRRSGEFRYASELVAFIRGETGDWFHIDVAALPGISPAGAQPAGRPRRFERKIDAGADSAITQYFYNADAYWHFVDACAARGHHGADRAGHHADRRAIRSSRASPTRAAPRFRAGSGAALEGFGDDRASIRAFGLDVVTDLCAGLLARGAPGLHFYTLNQAPLTTTIWQRLGLT